MTKRIFEISTGQGREEYTQVGFIVGTDKTDVRKLYAVFLKTYQFPPEYRGDMEVDEWWDANRKAEAACKAAGLPNSLSREDYFYEWLVKIKHFAQPEIYEVNL